MKGLRVFSLGAAILALASGCTGEQGRAVGFALARYSSQDAKVLTYVPMTSRDCQWGCYTEVCVALLLDAEKISKRRVVFVRVSGMDDSAMHLGGEYPSLAECQAKFDRG